MTANAIGMKTHHFRLRLVGSLQICWIWANINVFNSKLEQLSAHLVPSRLMMRRCIDSGQRQFGMCRASQLAVGGTAIRGHTSVSFSFYSCRLLDSEESCCCTELVALLLPVPTLFILDTKAERDKSRPYFRWTAKWCEWLLRSIWGLFPGAQWGSSVWWSETSPRRVTFLLF